jgi:tryptophanyl-tRNA synthetase
MGKPISLTGIKPTGAPHLGNYLGMIQPALNLVKHYQPIYFIADYHALTTLHDADLLKRYTFELAATWLAFGLNPDEVIFYRQSDVPQVFELSWILSCFTSKGLLNRAHAYKAMTDVNVSLNRHIDEGVNGGLFQYPVLMSSDILLFNADVVPVGYDQRQHVEIARDIATTFNTTFGYVLTIPEALIQETVSVIPGIDGRKMSKSYKNTIPLFAESKQLRKQIMRIVTDSKRPEDSKNPDECNVFAIYKHFAKDEDVQVMRERYIEGGIGYGDIKQHLFELLDIQFSEARETYYELIQQPKVIESILDEGAQKARHIAQDNLNGIRSALGVKVR